MFEIKPNPANPNLKRKSEAVPMHAIKVYVGVEV